MDEPSVLSSVLLGSMTLLVSRRQGLLYRCSSTVQASFPLSADCELWNCVALERGFFRRSHSGRGVNDGLGGLDVCV